MDFLIVLDLQSGFGRVSILIFTLLLNYCTCLLFIFGNSYCGCMQKGLEIWGVILFDWLEFQMGFQFGFQVVKHMDYDYGSK